MVDELFQLDTLGSTDNLNRRPVRYTTDANLDEDEKQLSKPSQERPAILRNKAKRYHEQTDENKFRPGKLSNNLLVALGLRSQDVPEHIYRMRQLGYPPGWLKKCEVQVNNISIIGADNVIVGATDQTIKYDCDKLHEYPGFNSYRGYNRDYDYSIERGFWQMNNEYLISNFTKKLQKLQMVGKEATDIKDIRLLNSNSKSDFSLPETSRKRPLETSTPRTGKKQKKNHSDLSDGELSESEPSEQEPSLSVLDVSAISVPEEARSDMGTLLLVAPTAKPSLDNFSIGIGDHRLFENLPNSGGVYKKVKSALDRNRTSVSTL